MTSSLRVLMVSDVYPASIQGGGERVLWEQASRLAPSVRARGFRLKPVLRDIAAPPDHGRGACLTLGEQ